MELTGAVVLITGASSGIASNGPASSAEGADGEADRLRLLAKRVAARATNVTDEDDIQQG